MLNFAIIGFGALGKVHFSGYEELKRRIPEAELVAICDSAAAAFSSQAKTNLGATNANLDLSAFRIYADCEEMFDKEKLDFVIVALPTFVRTEICVSAMRRGIHVFSEKPIALTPEDATMLLDEAKSCGVRFHVGQCLRFAPHISFLKDAIDSAGYGKVIRAEFNRISPLADWSRNNWLLDESKSGGAALDMHIHDTDLVNYLFGTPEAVSSNATDYKTAFECIDTVYHYPDGKLVTSIGDWGMPGCFDFEQSYTVRFERATLIFKNDILTVYNEGGEKTNIPLENVNCYTEEVVDFLDCIMSGKDSVKNEPSSAREALKIVLAEKESARLSKKIYLK